MRRDPLARMRRANPVATAEPPALEPILARLDRGDDPGRPPRRRLLRRLSRPAALALVLVPLGAAAVAVAASGLLTGEPIEPRPGATFSPSKGLGVPIAKSVKLLDVRAPDPDGGPDWGMRVLSTTRGLGCVQIGRVVGGRLGVLGRDGAFADDGRFHELPAKVLEYGNCTLLDGAGRTYLAVDQRGVAASAFQRGCAIQRIPEDVLRRLPNSARLRSGQLPLCGPRSVRVVRYGLLGPHATSVVHRDAAGQRVEVPVTAPQGAYLIVTKPQDGRPPDGQWTAMAGPGSGLERVRYRDGRVCVIRSPRALGGAKPCPPVGYVKPSRPRVTSAQVAAPIDVSVRPGTGRLRGQYVVELRFTARVAVRSGHSSYESSVIMPRSATCDPYGMGGPSLGNVAAGGTVRITFHVPRTCPGLVRGKVAFAYGDPLSAMPFGGGFGRDDDKPTVGRFVAKIPRSR